MVSPVGKAAGLAVTVAWSTRSRPDARAVAAADPVAGAAGSASAGNLSTPRCRLGMHQGRRGEAMELVAGIDRSQIPRAQFEDFVAVARRSAAAHGVRAVRRLAARRGPRPAGAAHRGRPLEPHHRQPGRVRLPLPGPREHRPLAGGAAAAGTRSPTRRADGAAAAGHEPGSGRRRPPGPDRHIADVAAPPARHRRAALPAGPVRGRHRRRTGHQRRRREERRGARAGAAAGRATIPTEEAGT